MTGRPTQGPGESRPSGSPVEERTAEPSQSAKERAARILQTPTPGQDLTKTFFPWGTPAGDRQD